jgi:hypothetical protein
MEQFKGKYDIANELVNGISFGVVYDATQSFAIPMHQLMSKSNT